MADGWTEGDRRFGLAAAHLECAVRLRCLHYRAHGGPGAFDRDAVRSFARDIAAHADELLSGGPHCADVMDKLVEAIAVLSFQPGGVHCAGLHVESIAGR